MMINADLFRALLLSRHALIHFVPCKFQKSKGWPSVVQFHQFPFVLTCAKLCTLSSQVQLCKLKPDPVVRRCPKIARVDSHSSLCRILNYIISYKRYYHIISNISYYTNASCLPSHAFGCSETLAGGHFP